MPFSWTRPKTAKFPSTFVNFQAFDPSGVDQVNYKIEDLHPSRFEDVINIMKEKHLIDEPMYSSKGIRDDPTSFQEMIENWRNMLEQKISLVCYENGSSEIAAVNVLGVVTKSEFDLPHNVNIYKAK